jgi:hypothetical protein
VTPNGFPIEPPTGALAELREQIDELALMAAEVFSAAVHDHIDAALAAVKRGDRVGARISLELASAMMDDESKHPGEWWKRC